MKFRISRLRSSTTPLDRAYPCIKFFDYTPAPREPNDIYDRGGTITISTLESLIHLVKRLEYPVEIDYSAFHNLNMMLIIDHHE